MASTREERMQQRLRGAQRRQVKDVDFGLSFAPMSALAQPPSLPAPIRRSPRRSLGLDPHSSTRPTPRSRARSQPPIATPTDENVRSVTIQSTVDANTSAKRRKLDTDEYSTSQRSTRSSFHTPMQDLYTLNAEEGPEALDAETTNGLLEQSGEIERTSELSAVFVPQLAERTPTPPMGEVEITESPSHAPGSGHRTRKTIVSAVKSSQLQDELPNQGSVRNEPSGSLTPQRKRKKTPLILDTGRSRRASRSNVSIDLDVSLEEVDELSPDQPRRGRRRRSSIQRQSLNDLVVAESDDEEETTEVIQDAETAAVLKRNRRGRRLSSRAPAEPSPDLDEPSEQPLVVPRKQRSRPHQIPNFSPAQQRHPKSNNSKVAPKPMKKTTTKHVRMGSPIPVTAYRLTKGAAYDEDESDADILNAQIRYAKRSGVNVIDVLSQVCQEIINSSLDTIQEHSRNAQDKASRREFRDKQRYVEAYGKELQTRLLEHTINLDNTFSLERRVREEQKRKVALRDEVLKIRAEREHVALRMDEIRIRHEMDSKDAEERDTLNTAVHDIELAVERGKEKNVHDPAHGFVEKIGVELILKRVASEVSNKSNTGGILKQIKDFNSFLEHAALALEGRKI